MSGEMLVFSGGENGSFSLARRRAGSSMSSESESEFHYNLNSQTEVTFEKKAKSTVNVEDIFRVI